MPDRYPTNDANRRRDTTPARTLRQAAAPGGVFRCDRCDRVVPDSLLVEQDGYSLCRTLCADEMSRTEDNLRLAMQLAETDSMAPNADPPTSAFDGAVSITATPTWPVTVKNDAGAVALAFTGVNLSSSVAISYGHAGITDASAPSWTSTTLALSLQATGVPDDYYDVTIGGSTYRRVLRVY